MSLASNLAGGSLSSPYAGNLFTLNRAGWVGQTEIGWFLQNTVDAALAAGNSLVTIPPGNWRCDRNIDVVAVPSGVDPGTHGITIAGAGEPSTDVFFHAGSEGFRFLGGPVLGGKNYVVRPTLRDLSVTCNGGARGVVLQETLFATVMNVWVARAGIGVDITDLGEGCQNTRMMFVTSQLNNINFHVKHALQLMAIDCISNQGTSKGWHIEQCNGTAIVGGMVQDHGIPFHVQPSNFNGVELTITGSTYNECDTPNIIQIDRAPLGPGYVGSIVIQGGMTVQGGRAFADGEVIRANDCALFLNGPISAGGWECLVRARTMDSAVITTNAVASRFDFDADSLTRTTFVGPHV